LTPVHFFTSPYGARALRPADPPATAEARLDEALERLAEALDALDAACARRAALDAQRGDLVEELAVMQDDRARLAAELDAASARAQALEAAQIQVGRRLARAGETIRAVIMAAEREGEG
jgi:chromosome segregation ATPase